MKAHGEDLQRLYIGDLERHVKRYVSILEGIFGQRDSRFVFGSIGMSEERPRTNYPENFHMNGGCRVDILISQHPWKNRCLDQGPWQIAHECVHLLDPGKRGTANILEEGLATWFQNEPIFHDEVVKRYIANSDDPLPAYVEAQELVRRSLPEILQAVKKLRGSGIRIREIKADALAPLLPNAETGTVERLCNVFQDYDS